MFNTLCVCVCVCVYIYIYIYIITYLCVSDKELYFIEAVNFIWVYLKEDYTSCNTDCDVTVFLQ